jgi:hypothetical protein
MLIDMLKEIGEARRQAAADGISAHLVAEVAPQTIGDSKLAQQQIRRFAKIQRASLRDQART